ncbi:uncharacterized protein PFLUO_LOCUS2007 [Penicillium psychrofluorescens]|uniref:uncharacterized protein n=1 Tax=Penicillium psychrofluorescens TaxID=3158075 RepID=UPI003CCD0F7E
MLASVSCRCSPACCSLQAGVFSASATSLFLALARPSTPSLKPRATAAARRTFHFTPGRRSSDAPPSSSSPRLSYRVAVSSSGKGRRFHPLKNAYNFDPNAPDALGVLTLDKSPANRRRHRPDSGEDAFFVSRIGSRHSEQQRQEGADAIAFAVADGVGGWTESRVDPADFSHGICGYMAHTAMAWDEPAHKLRPKQLLQAGYDQVVADPSIRAGGSTASVGVGLPDGRVELANLGDSGSVLLRLAAVHHYSVPQTHGFNTPYQLSIIPPRMRAQASVFGGAFLEDFPRDAVVTNIQMQHGDVLLLATDGVFDNLNNQDILKLITSRMVLTGAWTATPELGISVADNLRSLAAPGGLAAAFPPPSESADSATRPEASLTLQSLLAATVAGEAKMASIDYRRDGPFAKEAQRSYPGDHYRGGKVDDISALVIVAVDESLAREEKGL